MRNRIGVYLKLEKLGTYLTAFIAHFRLRLSKSSRKENLHKIFVIMKLVHDLRDNELILLNIRAAHPDDSG